MPIRKWEGLKRGENMSDLTPEQFDEILCGDPDELSVHLTEVEKNIKVDCVSVSIHCHCLTVDANGRVRLARLAEFMRSALIDYAIPKSKVEQARQRDAQFKSGSAMSALHYEAKATFSDLDKSGEGGELLLFLLAERFLKIPQILCKMELKTDTRMHYHGADGVYGRVDTDGILNLYWGESKLYADATAAIRDCLASLAPFLIEDDSENADRERDLVLLSDKADLSDPNLTDALKKYFDKTSPKSNRVRYGGVALVGFDSNVYPDETSEAVVAEITAAARFALEGWSKNIKKRLQEEKLDKVKIEFFCVPVPSVERFRAEFKKALGLT